MKHENVDLNFPKLYSIDANYFFSPQFEQPTDRNSHSLIATNNAAITKTFVTTPTQYEILLESALQNALMRKK